MPFSHNRFDEYMKSLIFQTGYDTWLDVGAGAGKFGKMVKQILPNAYILGIEINRDYVDKYKLREKYDGIMCFEAVQYLMNHPSDGWDGIILGDFLEHLPKSQGVDLVNFLVYRCKLMIIIYPIERIQNGYQGYGHEAHISIWGKSDWNNFEHQIVEDPASHLVVIDGYIEHERINVNVFA
jgi:hypothetical protein